MRAKVSVRIDPLPPEAAPLLSAQHRACFPEDPWGPDAIAQISRIPGFFGAVAAEGPQPVGFVLALNLGRECEILSLGVTPAERRRGVAASLLTWAGREAGRRGADALVLEVAEDNAAARSLYAAKGFQAIGRRENYYRRAEGAADALVLRLALHPKTST